MNRSRRSQRQVKSCKTYNGSKLAVATGFQQALLRLSCLFCLAGLHQAEVCAASLAWQDRGQSERVTNLDQDDQSAEISNYLADSLPHPFDSARVLTETIKLTGKREPATDHAKQLRLVELHPTLSSHRWVESELKHEVALDDEGRFRVTLPRFVEGYDRLYSRWCLVGTRTESGGKVERLSAIVYHSDLTEIQNESTQPLKIEQVADKKGLGGIHFDPQLYPDLLELGIRQLIINISLAGLIDPSGQSAIGIEFGTERIAIQEPTLRRLDKIMEFSRKNEMVVSAVLLSPRLSPDHVLYSQLTHPDCAGGNYSIANLATEQGASSFIALMQFLGERYSGDENSKGRIENWIVHNEVDAAWVWTNFGEKSQFEFMDLYVRAMRIVDLATRRYNPSSQAFISLTHSWTKPHQPNPNRYYPARSLLEQLQVWSEREGDFPWGIAYHPYAENLFNLKIWEDPNATSDDDSTIVTFKNLEVLDRWVQDPKHHYQPSAQQDAARLSSSPSVVRTILLSEQGFHSGNQSAEHQRFQAASLVYAWKKIAALESIEAFHYHRWIDHEREGGLRVGLWTVKEGSITYPAEKKKSWSVMQALGTESEADVTQEFEKLFDGTD